LLKAATRRCQRLLAGAYTGAGAAADGLAHPEALEALGVLGLHADGAENMVDYLCALVMVALGPVPFRARVLVHEVSRAGVLAE
jgi:hypothetical protein